MAKLNNEKAWELIFEKHRILDKIQKSGRVSISAGEINEFREARLMTKFDHRSQLPKVFSTNGLSVLPVSRGGYEIGLFETFCNFNNEEVAVKSLDFPHFFESIDCANITSEAAAINCAYLSKMLGLFTGEENLHPTVSGRMSSSAFEFKIDSSHAPFHVKIENAQIEIDGGYEGDHSLILIEAKNYISDDFLIRQLYYPYRLWKGKINKKVRPVFLTYSNGIFHLREYEFLDDESYNSISLVKHAKYSLNREKINTECIQRILAGIKIEKEPEIPFPQADSFERVINLCELLKERAFLSKEEITLNYDFDPRQTDYYTNAAKYLGLAMKADLNDQIGCTLTPLGLRIFSMPVAERQLEFVKLILSHRVFKDVLELYFAKGSAPATNEVVEIMRRAELYKVNSEVTYRRRKCTVNSWINWILELIEE